MALKRAPCICTLFAISDDIFCVHFAIFNCALFSHPNEAQLVIRGRETMTCLCNEVSDVFYWWYFLNVFQNSFFICTIYIDYIMDIVIQSSIVLVRIRTQMRFCVYVAAALLDLIFV